MTLDRDLGHTPPEAQQPNPENLKVTREMPLASLLDIWKIPGLQPKEKIFIRIMTRNLQVQQLENGQYRLKNAELQAKLEQFVHDYDGKKKPFSSIVSSVNPHSVTNISSAAIITSLYEQIRAPIKIVQSLKNGDFLDRGMNKSTEYFNCMEFSLMAAVLAKLFYDDEAVAIPLGYSEHTDVGTSRHFMLWWAETTGEEIEPHLTRYTGDTVKEYSYDTLKRTVLRPNNPTLSGLAKAAENMEAWVSKQQQKKSS